MIAVFLNVVFRKDIVQFSTPFIKNKPLSVVMFEKVAFLVSSDDRVSLIKSS